MNNKAIVLGIAAVAALGFGFLLLRKKKETPQNLLNIPGLSYDPWGRSPGDPLYQVPPALAQQGIVATDLRDHCGRVPGDPLYGTPNC